MYQLIVSYSSESLSSIQRIERRPQKQMERSSVQDTMDDCGVQPWEPERVNDIKLEF